MEHRGEAVGRVPPPPQLKDGHREVDPTKKKMADQLPFIASGPWPPR